MAPAPWGPAPFTFKAQMLGGVTKVAVEVAGAAKGEGFMILVTGGTGFIGSAIVKQLLDDGIDVSVLGRDGNKIRAVFGDRVEAREADVGNRDRLREAFKGADVVINAVQFPSSPIEIPRRGWTFEEVDFKGTCNQVDAGKRTRLAALFASAALARRQKQTNIGSDSRAWRSSIWSRAVSSGR